MRKPLKPTRDQLRDVYSPFEPDYRGASLSTDEISHKAFCLAIAVLAIGVIMAWAINGG